VSLGARYRQERAGRRQNVPGNRATGS